MKLLALAACVTSVGSIGCLWANANSDWAYGYDARTALASDGSIEGGSLRATVGMAGLYADGELALHDATRRDDPGTYRALGAGFSVRGSLFGILGNDHRLERYFDIGAEAGWRLAAVLALPERDIAAESIWYGAWTELGTLAVAGGYVAVTGGIRREVAEHPWIDQTQLIVGLAWRKRGPLGPHWRR